MSSRSIATRSARKADQSSRIPRPSCDQKTSRSESVADSASPILIHNKRRHLSEPAPSDKQICRAKQSKVHNEKLESPRRSSRLSKTPLAYSDAKNCASDTDNGTEAMLRSKRRRSSSEATPTGNKRHHSTRNELSVILSPSSKENQLSNKTRKAKSLEDLSCNETSSFNSTFTIEKTHLRSELQRKGQAPNARCKSPSINSKKLDGKSDSNHRPVGVYEASFKETHKMESCDSDPTAQSQLIDSSSLTPAKIKVKVNTPPGVPEEDLIKIPEDLPRRRNSGSARKKSKRRSSFVRGRISKVFPVISDVSLEIPSELPAPDRLAELTTAVTRYTLNKLHEELPDLEGLQQFEVEVQSAVDSTKEKLLANRTFALATVKDRIMPNPANEVISQTIEDRTLYTQRLKVECERWEELLQLRKDEASKAERALEEIRERPITEQPASGFTPPELSFMAERPNYTEMLDTLNGYREEATLSIKEIVRIVSTFQHCQETASRVLSQHTQKIYDEAFGDIPSFEKPQDLVESVLMFKD